MLILLFAASFLSVFLLGLQSQFVRDQRAALCFAISWFVSASQFTYTRITAMTESPELAFISSGLGGSVGIVASIYFYRWFSPWYQRRTNRDKQ